LEAFSLMCLWPTNQFSLSTGARDVEFEHIVSEFINPTISHSIYTSRFILLSSSGLQSNAYVQTVHRKGVTN
jgi:hypothetical protein